MSRPLLFKKFSPEAVPPSRAHDTDGGFDLTALRTRQLPNDVTAYETDIGVCIPPGFVGILKERSSVRKKSQVLVGGVIDAGYTGKIEVSFQNLGNLFGEPSHFYAPGDKVCQLVIVPLADFNGVQEVEELPTGERGENGFGSTGN